MSNIDVHFTKEDMRLIEDAGNSAPKNIFGETHYYEYYSAAFVKMLREKTGIKNIITTFCDSGRGSWAVHTNKWWGEYGYGRNFKIFEIVKKPSGFTEDEVNEDKLIIPFHHDVICMYSEEDGKLRMHTSTGNISMQLSGKQFTTKGHLIMSLLKIAKDISFSVELESGEILNYKY